MEFLMKQLFQWTYRLSGNYGIALILLSVAVTLIMIPLFWISEKIQEKDKKKKQAMKEDLKKLNDVSNPQEKHFYTMEIYRIHQYHPAQSLVGLLGLCIQIPFFIAAYRMLDHYTPLSGVSFGPIQDLFQPDGLFFGINILPFLMTGINLISGYFYSRDMDKNEKLQLAAVSLLFLFLLYNKPSAMVLYWTMNNLLAIGKNWLLGHPPHLPRLSRPAWFDRLKSMDLKPFRIWLMILPGIIFLIPAVLLNEHRMPLRTVFVLLLEFQLLITTLIMFHRFYWKDRNWFLGLITLGIYLVHLVMFLNPLSHKNYKFQMFLILTQIPLLLLHIIYILVEPFRDTMEHSFDQHKRLFNRMAILGMILFSALICLYSPLTLYSSDVKAMAFPLGQLTLWHGLYSILLIALAVLFYVLSPKRIKLLLSLLFTSFGLMAWFYTYLLPGNYGVLDVTSFTDPGRLNVFRMGFTKADVVLSALEILILAVALIVLLRWLINEPRKGFTAILLLNIISLSQTVIPLMTTEGITKVSSGTSAFLPDNTDQVFRMSPEDNRLIFMFDMFGADLIPQILEEYPELKEALDGFIWFPNTLSTGIVTYGSLPSILGGTEYTPHRVNQRGVSSLDEMYEEVYSRYPQYSDENGFEMTYVDPMFYKSEDLAKKGVNVTQSINYMEYWLSQSEEAASLDMSLEADDYTRIFTAVGLFKAMPHFLRPFIYLDGRWLMMARGNMSLKHTASFLGFLDLIDDFIHIEEGKKVFKFFYNNLNHSPWSINEELEMDDSMETVFIRDPVYNVSKPSNEGVYYTAARTLFEIASVLDKLEEMGIKDQTRIILVSDHGYTGVHRQWTDVPVIYAANNRVVEGASRVNCLLLVKDFNARGPLQIDQRLMTIADVPALIEPPSPWTEEDIPRHDEVYVSFTHRLQEKNGPIKFNIKNDFRVTGDPSDPENWHWIAPE